MNGLIEKLDRRLADHQFLVGDQFSRADLAMAALFSPLALPASADRHAANEPEAFTRLKDEYRERLGWVAHTYKAFR